MKYKLCQILRFQNVATHKSVYMVAKSILGFTGGLVFEALALDVGTWCGSGLGKV